MFSFVLVAVIGLCVICMCAVEGAEERDWRLYGKRCQEQLAKNEAARLSREAYYSELRARR